MNDHVMHWLDALATSGLVFVYSEVMLVVKLQTNMFSQENNKNEENACASVIEILY